MRLTAQLTRAMLAKSVVEEPLFHVAPLPAGQAAATLAFIRLVEPAVTPERWRAFVRAYGRVNPGGLMTICDRRGYVHGLFSWRPSCSISHGRTLRIADVVMARLPGGAALRAFLDEVKQLASAFGCETVMIELGDRSRHVRADLESLTEGGFSGHAVVWSGAAESAAAV